VTFLFDNNMPRALAQALRILGKGVTHVAEIQQLGHGAQDRLILEYAGPQADLVVTRDIGMRKMPRFRADLIRLRVGVFMFRMGRARQPLAWEIARIVINAWDNMEAFAHTNHVPFVALVQRNGRVVMYK